ncbi:hypothetical protein DL240_08840 [Lujinxingia litoralis]|uniref:Uncharacterized protein n=2 Tax=Lujinxingia litoralis TaxID=2211119 RepID=A0A328C6U8_9DELT|nr:hypothetical protein DL240_08840 [Lujinxingia litoralis]
MSYVLSFCSGFFVAVVLTIALFFMWGVRGGQDAGAEHETLAHHNDLPRCEPGEALTQALPDDEQLLACQASLESVRASHEEALETFQEHEDLTDYLTGLLNEMSPDRPVAFPEELDEAYQPEQFEASVEALKGACPEVFGEEARADCSEYPCMIEFPYQSARDERVQEVSVKELCPALSTFFPGRMSQEFVTEVGDETWVQYMPHGTGIGLQERLAGQEMRLMQRARMRWEEKERSLAVEKYEDTCVRAQDVDACRHLAYAFGSGHPERDIYTQIGCDAGDARACYAYANDRCEKSGRCDAEAEHFARRSVTMAPESGYMHENLGIVLCTRGALREARRSFEQACALGWERACGRACG